MSAAATTTRHYYAATYPYGVTGHSAVSGALLRTIYRFDSIEERDAWVAEGGDYRTQPDWREPVTAREISAHERANLRESDGSPVWTPGSGY